MRALLTKRRLLLAGAATVVALTLGIVLARVALTGAAIGYALREAGASAITFNVRRASPWRVVVDDVAFLLQAQEFSAKRVSIDRRHWWSASLGQVRVEAARVPLQLEQMMAKMSAAPAPEAAPRSAPPNLPLEELSVDGQVVIQAPGLPDKPLTVKFDARQAEDGRWVAQLGADGPGLMLRANGNYNVGKQQLDFSVPALTLDLHAWRAFAESIVPVPAAADWDLQGRLTAHGEGRYASDAFIMNASVQLKDGRIDNAEQGITAEGVDLDLEFSDVAKLRSKPGTVRIREVRTKQLPLQAIVAEFALVGPDRIEVARATLAALGGNVSTEPFIYEPGADAFDAVVVVNGISVEQVMALTKDLPAVATGRVNGRFPITIGANGLHFGTGWLELSPGVNAEIAFNASGLLTAGTSPKSPSYSVLQKIESGLLKLKISELRLDIQPTGAPAGRSATLHLAGAPVDPEVKAPVILDLNVNGPLEKLLKLGMDSRLSVGAKP